MPFDDVNLRAQNGGGTAVPMDPGIVSRVVQGALGLAGLGRPGVPTPTRGISSAPVASSPMNGIVPSNPDGTRSYTGNQRIPTATDRSGSLYDLFSGWFGPNVPIRPVAPDDTKGRAADYNVGYNLNIQPRAGEPISFAQLRALADAQPIVRLAIETRKDQMAKLNWSILPRSQPNTSSRSKPPQIAADIEAFLSYPDGVHGWTDWLRLLLEDLFVIDAPAIYVRQDADGAICGLDVVDGSTIKVVIDKDGRMPEPPYPAYQQVLHGLPANEMTSDELIYRPRNPRPHKFYGYSPVEQMIITINTAIRRDISMLQYYTEGNIPEAIIGVPPEWTTKQIREFQEYWDSTLEGNTAARRHAKFVPGGLTFNRTQLEQSLKNDFDEWIARIVCYAFSLPPLPFVKQMNRASAETSVQLAEDEGLQPLMVWTKNLMDYLMAKYFGQPGLEFVWDDIAEQDPHVAAAIDTQYVQIGAKSVDEIRADLGMEPIGMDHAVWGIGPLGIMFVSDLVQLKGSPTMVPPAQPPGGMLSPPGGALGGAQSNPIEGVPYHVLQSAGLPQHSLPPPPARGSEADQTPPPENQLKLKSMSFSDPVVRAALGKRFFPAQAFRQHPVRSPALLKRRTPDAPRVGDYP